MLRGPGRGPDGGRRLGVRRELVAFVAVALIVLLAVAAATILITDRIARDSARREAEVTARRMASILVAPLLENVLKGEPEDQRDLDQIMRIRMRDGTVTAAFVWRAVGKIASATDKDFEGRTLALTPELR